MRPRSPLASTVLLALVTTAAAGLHAQSVNPDAAAVKAFGERVKAYVDLRQRVAQGLVHPAMPATAAEIERFKRQLAQGIREERRSAKEGDIFTADIAPQFREIIRADLKSRDMEDALAAVAEVSPRLALYVNDPWPRDLPRATIPPRLLARLHPLPEGVEYRFLSRHLVLLDSDADLIIDLVRNVIPSSVRREP